MEEYVRGKHLPERWIKEQRDGKERGRVVEAEGHVEAKHGQGDDAQHGGHHSAPFAHPLVAASAAPPTATGLKRRHLCDLTGTTTNRNIHHHTSASSPATTPSSTTATTTTTPVTIASLVTNSWVESFTTPTTSVFDVCDVSQLLKPFISQHKDIPESQQLPFITIHTTTDRIITGVVFITITTQRHHHHHHHIIQDPFFRFTEAEVQTFISTTHSENLRNAAHMIIIPGCIKGDSLLHGKSLWAMTTSGGPFYLNIAGNLEAKFGSCVSLASTSTPACCLEFPCGRQF